MAIYIDERTNVPITDLDAGVIVYVPGYAVKGPEWAYCNALNFTDIYGDKPYVFKDKQLNALPKNRRFTGQPEKSWKFAKALTDAGLTVIYHRYTSKPIVAYADNAFSLEGRATSTSSPVEIGDFGVRAKYFGEYYDKIYVQFFRVADNTYTVDVYSSYDSGSKFYGNKLESRTISFNPSSRNFIGYVDFVNIEFYVGEHSSTVTPRAGLDSVTFSDFFSNNPKGIITFINEAITDGKVGAKITNPDFDGADEFTVGDFELALAEEGNDLFTILEDTNTFPSVSYVTTGGYFQNSAIIKRGTKVASNIFANQFSVAWGESDITDSTSVTNFRTTTLVELDFESPLQASFACLDIGADTYAPQGDRDIYPDYFGKFLALAGNIKSGIPAWMPIANNSNGMLTSAIATTTPISKSAQDACFSDTGISINPIIYKYGIGFVRMGNRTMYPNSGVLTADSFENCRTVTSTIARVVRKAADSLQIARTNPTATFREFESLVLPTANKMLVNGDGLNSIAFRKLPKTKPATIDIAIDLVLVEGIEEFHVTIIKSLNMEG